MAADETQQFKSGYVALVGAPNVGKSTLLNRMLEQKISITAPKPQTTRNRVVGILNGNDYQVILVDTPGIHKPRDEFNRGLVDTALSALQEADAIVFMVEPEKMGGHADEFILKNLRGVEAPVILVINKIDTLKNKGELLPLIDRYREAMDFSSIIPISALKGDGVAEIMKEIIPLLPEGPRYYPGDDITDQPEKFFVAELVREKVFHLIHQEIPYAVAVVVDRFTEIPENNIIEIDVTIHVERDSQKGVIIGKGGLMLKEIGKQARKEIEIFLGSHIYLSLFVRVQKNWRKDPRALLEFGYRQGR